MREILMNETEFKGIIENCIEYIFDDASEAEKKLGWNELYDILNVPNNELRWAKLIASDIFRIVIGNWREMDNFKVWVED